MPNWVLVKKDSKTFHDGECRNDTFKDTCQINETMCWLEVPEGIAPGNAKVLDTAGVLSLIDGAADKAGPKWSAMRAARNAKLLECDFTQLADCSLGAPKTGEYVTYRQALKDLPANTEDPDQITWPTKPE